MLRFTVSERALETLAQKYAKDLLADQKLVDELVTGAIAEGELSGDALNQLDDLTLEVVNFDDLVDIIDQAIVDMRMEVANSTLTKVLRGINRAISQRLREEVPEEV